METEEEKEWTVLGTELFSIKRSKEDAANLSFGENIRMQILTCIRWLVQPS